MRPEPAHQLAMRTAKLEARFERRRNRQQFGVDAVEPHQVVQHALGQRDAGEARNVLVGEADQRQPPQRRLGREGLPVRLGEARKREGDTGQP
ncbi:MAG: hypothetical protein EOQ93_32390, partial [Mesorhizobium sp.]